MLVKTIVLVVKRAILLNIFLFTQIIFVIAASFDTDFIKESVNRDLNSALFLHLVSIISFLVAYVAFNFLNKRRSNNIKYINHLKYYYLRSSYERWLYVICVIGVVVSLYQIGKFISLETYFFGLLKFDNPGNLREYYLAPKEEGGLPGIIKMWAYGPLAVFMFSYGVKTYLPITKDTERKITNIILFSLVATVIKVLISLDRLSILAIVLSFIVSNIQKNTLLRFRNMLFLTLVIFFATFVSYNRLDDVGVIDFLILYCRLGIVNISILINELRDHSYGFFTILSPLRYIIKFFTGQEFGLQNLNYSYSWHAAQYLLGYAYLDFGYLFFILYVFLGYIASKLDFKAAICRVPWAVSIYFSALYCFASFIFVPAFTGLEFWLTVVIGLWGAKGLLVKST